MKPRGGMFVLMLSLGLGAFLPGVSAQQSEAGRQLLAYSCAHASLSGAVTVRAPKPEIAPLSLCEGHALGGNTATVGQGRPVALASGDFDEDGVPDLVSGFASGRGGQITIHRGNVAALWPYGASLRNGPPAAFLSNARAFALPEIPDFLAVGDFDADGHWDIVSAQQGSSVMYFLRGDGHGGFRPAKSIALGGAVTALISGEINRTDGLTDLMVAVNTASGPRALIFESPMGAVKGQPESFKLPHAATALALGRLDGGAMQDLAIAAGNQIVVIHARDRKLALDEAQRASVAPARVSSQTFSFTVQALVSGDFSGTGPSVAALGTDGQIHILEHRVTKSALAAMGLNASGESATMQVANADQNEKQMLLKGRTAPSLAAKLSAMRQSAMAAVSSAEWTERGSVSLPGGFAQASPRLVAGRITGSLEEDILAVDSGNRQVHVLSTGSVGGRARALTSGANGITSRPMRLVASLDAIAAPVAVLPMRLSPYGLQGLVMLHEGQSEPTVMPQDTPPANIFTVTNTSDAVIVDGINKTGPAGSLRKAIFDANHATGPSSIVFNIPTSDPNYNATTGTFLIRPLSESVPNAFDNFALPPINNTILIDGYSQPGASPNTLANGDNAKILIQIDGSRATTPGGSGLVPFDDVGSVMRGLNFTGWVNPAFSGNTASGAQGIEANGVGDFIEGNFFGTDPGGKTALANRIGIFADNGPLFGGAPGNIIGGTTPQARNILSGNQQGGILFLAIAYEGQLQGNFIGTDITGTKALPNTKDGAGLNGPTITIGGTLPGATNVISGNGTNVDINDLTNINLAKNSIVQGNLIGTDVTGTRSLSVQGYGVSIQNNPQSMTIGGTTPAARNVISGNYAGVAVLDNSFYNVVQGNYIGVDITGTKAVPNVNGGFVTGATQGISASSQISAADTTIGGSVAGAGNIISGNAMDGISVAGTSNGPNNGLQALQGNIIQGNFIGTDASGTKAIPNQGNGISLTTNATNNLIGGSNPGLANLIANNAGDGVHVDPVPTTSGQGVGNNTIANIILSNNGAGVRVKSGSGNRISQNSIFGNKALGIDVDIAGPNANTHCNASNSGANGLQNAPVLTAGSGTGFISATATDPNGNTSEFSNAVKAPISGNILSLLGNFDSAPSTSYTIEFFSNTAADASGFGQGQTYISSTNVSTDANCTVSINNPVDTTQADVSIKLVANTTAFNVGADFGSYSYTGIVTNNGAAIAHNVVFTDILPSGLEISSAYCNVASCQTPILTTLGICTVNHQTVTCTLGTMAPGATASITIPVQATSAASIANTATVKATEADPKLSNNTDTVTTSVTYPYPFIDHIDPTSAVTISSGSMPLTVFGNGFLPTTAITFNGTAVTTTGYLDNQVCGGPFSPGFCSAVQVTVPASLLGTAGTYTVTATNPDPGPGGGSNFPSSTQFTLVASCTYNPQFFGFNPVDAEGDTLIPESISVSTNAPSCPWTATSNAPWLVILDNSKGIGNGSLDVAVAPNTGAARSGTLTVAGKTVEIDQAAGDSTICTYGLNPASANIPAAGISGTFAVTTASGCSYFVEPYPQDSTYVKGVQFITIPQSSGLLVGNGSPSYTVAANHGAPRTGAIMVGGNVFTLTQDGPACYYTLDSTSALIPATGGSGTIGVKASSASCKWTAKSSDSSQVAITSGASGTGNGTVKYNVPANTGGPETPTITIGDATGYSVYSITQASAFTCSFTISPTPRSVGSNGTTDFFTVTASYSFCKWTASSNDPSSLTITGPSSGTGTKAVFYAVGQNTTGAPRTLTITAGCNTFTVNQDGAQASNPVPTITTLLPDSATAGSGAFTLTVNGSNFVNGSVVKFNGNARATTFVSATKLNAAILAADVATASTSSVTVTNPGPGGGTSTALTFTVNAVSNPVPAITSLQPNTAKAGSVPFTLTVNGTGFLSSSVVKFGGSAKATTFVSATQLTAAILASDIASVGTPAVTVTNPTPGGGASNSLVFTITAADNPVPAITALLPTGVKAGSGAFTLTVNGTGFISSSVVSFNGTSRTTTFVSATQVKASILASDVAATGSPKVVVTNPAPGGGPSNSLILAVSAANNPVPTITTLQPATATAGSPPFTLTVNGTGFMSGSVVSFNGNARTTTFVSATQLTAAISASDIASVSTPAVIVTNPTPGGGASNAVNFTVAAPNNPVPAITSLQPSSIKAGSSSFTLTVIGTGFVNNSQVKWNGSVRATTFVSATQLSAVILTSDVAYAGSASVTVTSPTPGGGTSNSITFTITPAGTPQPTLNPTALTFPNTNVGSASSAQNIVLSNIGTAPLTIASIAITGVNAGDFAQTSNCGSSLAIDETCTVAVIFKPTAAVIRNATLTITDNASVSTQTSTLSGVGVAVPAPVVLLTPASLAFSTLASTTSSAQTATLMNTGNATLTITGISIGGTNASSFAQTNNCGNSLESGSSCSISITFMPAAAGSFTAKLSVADNATGSPHIMALTGTGTPPPSFTISSPTGAQTVIAGGAVSYSITVSAKDGAFTNAVTFAASGLPEGATATFSPASVTPGSSSATSQLSIQTAAATPATAGLGSALSLTFAGLPLIGLFFVARKYRKRWMMIAVLAIGSFGAITTLSGCGGGFALPGSGAKNYSITVTGTSGAEQQTTTVQLTVQ